MDWREYIISDKEILVGKPTIKGTRISVELILDLLANGWTEKMIFESYPRLTENDLKAVKFLPQRPRPESGQSRRRES